MKKRKVDAVVRKHAAEARASGERAGKEAERRRWEAILPRPGQDGVTWLEHDPHRGGKLAQLLLVEGGRSFGFNPESNYIVREHQVLRFEAVPMALSLANGQQVRWFHWKPIGPYPAHELAVVR